MAKITEDMKIQINELYYVNHNKALTARTLGISASSVSRYLIPDYIPISSRQKTEPFNETPSGCQDFLEYVLWGKDEIYSLSDSEKQELKKLQRTIF